MADDYGNTPATAGRLTVGVDASGTIDTAGDTDWLGIQLLGGHNYIIQENGASTGDGTLTDPLLRFYNAAGTLLTQNDDGGYGLNSELAIHANTSGTYYVSAGAFSSATGTYQLEVHDTGTTGR
ncbi:hypothetical protein MTL_23245, partial [Methylobacterium goesingense]|nr:hypothetical protein [Methylobacterium goesingense]